MKKNKPHLKNLGEANKIPTFSRARFVFAEELQVVVFFALALLLELLVVV